MPVVTIPEPCPYERIGPYYPGVEYTVDEPEATRLVEVKGFVVVEPDPEPEE